MLQPVRGIGVLAISTPEGYRALDDRSVAEYLAALPAIRARLGGEPAGWRVSEVGDGNLNLVFIVDGPAGDLCVKQALPYVRLVGESWPLDLKRAWFEHRAASIQSRHARERIPELLHFDEQLYLIAMERCRPARHHAARHDPGRGLPSVRRADRRVSGHDALLHLRHGAAGGGEAGAGGRLLRQHRAVQDHRGPDLHRPLHGLRPQSLDQPAARRPRGRDPRRCRPQARRLGAQAEVPQRSAGPAARRPAHRLDHGDGRGHQGDRPGVRGRWGRWASMSASSWATC